jgi:hypothetical protein
MSYHINKIKSFDQIKLHYNTLVLSDIDETILKFDQVNKEWWKTRKQEAFDQNPETYAFGKWMEVISVNKPTHTDHSGFFRLLERIKKTRSDIQFVTARNTDLVPHTQTHFETLGLNHMDFQIHHLGGFEKGQYIKTQINTNQYDHVIFIDDLEHNIKSVLDHLTHPGLQVYLFEME